MYKVNVKKKGGRNMERLENIVQIKSGSPQFRIVESIDNLGVVYSFYGQSELENDLVNLEIVNEESPKIRTNDQVNLTKQGDVMYSLISGKATIIRVNHQGYIYTQNYVKLTPSEVIDARYLVYLLNEDVNIIHQLNMSLQGSIVHKYTVNQLRKLQLNKLPNLKKQQIIGELYFNQLHLKSLREQVAALDKRITLEKIRKVKNNE